MPTFKDTQQALDKALQDIQKQEQLLHQSRARRENLREQQRAFSRFFRDNTPGHQERKAQLDTALKETDSLLSRQQKQLAVDSGRLAEALKAFAVMSDPRESMGELSDQIPILLFPLRLETRFKAITGGGNELWVRAFPDECQIDSFEPTLSVSEVRNLKQYWTAFWAAGRIREEEKAAWTALAGKHGSGRAWWLLQEYRPVSALDQRPEKTDASTVILVVAAENLPSETEQTALADYWVSVLKAGEDADLRKAAQDQLLNTIGSAETVAALLDQYSPVNFKSAWEQATAEASIKLAFLQLPDQVPTQQQAWSNAPRVHTLPDRLVFMAYQGEELVIEELGAPIRPPLYVGPDPMSELEKEIDDELGADVKVDEKLALYMERLSTEQEISWLFNFDAAVDKGMGFRIPLSAEQARRGFDKVLVLGVRLSADAERGETLLIELFQHHHYSRKGFQVLPQGTPTNNTEASTSDWTHWDDPALKFEHYFPEENRADSLNRKDKRDGRWLAESLGINPEVLREVPNYFHTDIREGMAMNEALFPATLGYFMETMMDPVFSEATIDKTRSFFTTYLNANGSIPAIRIGKQPYGILTTTAFSRLSWPIRDPDPTHASTAFLNEENIFYHQLYQFLKGVRSDWETLLSDVSRVGQEGDAHQILLDVLGLHAGSVEHYQRYAQSAEQLFNTMNLKGLGGLIIGIILAGGYLESGKNLLERFGQSTEQDALPEILEKFFLQKPNPLKGGLIDDIPLSEKALIRNYTETGENYLKWIVNAARQSHDALRKQEGFLDNQRPTALLYHLLRHALDFGFLDASFKLHVKADVLQVERLRGLKKDQPFLQIASQPETPAFSKYQFLYKKDQRIDEAGRRLSEFIPTLVGNRPEARLLQNQIEAIERLAQAPTARLERSLVGHLDSCTYRLDAWISGLVQQRLNSMRFEEPEQSAPARRGIYLGAFGWLLDLKPENKQLRPAVIPEELQPVFEPTTAPQLMTDNTNGGFIHAPSPNHAVTAAVLRNAYLENARPSEPSPFAVNLSSERVRMAMAIIEGMQQGQRLGALLGYQFERGMHDRHSEAEVDAFIYYLRAAFPLSSQRMKDTKAETDEEGNPVPIQAVEARNVLDGLALLEHIEASGNTTYPFGKDLPAATPAQQAVINSETERIRNINDAVADLAMAESVHQVVQGNYDRGAGVLDAFSKGAFPPTPDVVRTPRSGTGITHRVGLHLRPGMVVADPATANPRLLGAPELNEWLGLLLPDLSTVLVPFTYLDADTHVEITDQLTLSVLDWEPLDYLYTLRLEEQSALAQFEDELMNWVRSNFNTRPDGQIRFSYFPSSSTEGAMSVLEFSSLVGSVRKLLQTARPLRPGDIQLSNEATLDTAQQQQLREDRITLPLNRLTELKGDDTKGFDLFFKNISEQVAETTEDSLSNQAVIIDQLDQYIVDYSDLLIQLGRFGLPAARSSFLFDKKGQIFAALRQKLKSKVEKWQERLTSFNELLITYNALPVSTTEEERLALLRTAERKISTSYTEPLPATADDFRDALQTGKGIAFQHKLTALETILNGPATDLKTLYTLIDAEITGLAPFDVEPMEIETEARQMVVLATDIRNRAERLIAELQQRTEKAADLLVQASGSSGAEEQIELRKQAGKLLLGEDFIFLSEFSMSALHTNEWQNNWDNPNRLLSYVQAEKEMDFPVDEWLNGIARVREKMHQLEQCTLLSEAMTNYEFRLEPLQFPFRENDSWMALPFPEDYEFDGDRLCYSLHQGDTAFDPASPTLCGLLLDEWTEVVPTREETTGISFHYDRPNAEPPQAMLLAVPPVRRGQWQWQDLVDTLHETLDFAQLRAIEPKQLKQTDYPRFLPATVSAVTMYPFTIALNYAVNNGLLNQLSLADNE